MNPADEIWAFALGSVDYWQLLSGDEEPAEVAAMPDERREAFVAARNEVQRRYTDLLRRCWEALRERAVGTPLESTFSKNPQGRTLRSGRADSILPANKGWVLLSIEDDGEGRLALYASARCAKKREGLRRQHFATATSDDVWSYHLENIAPEESAEGIAERIAERFFPELLSYVTAQDNSAEFTE